MHREFSLANDKCCYASVVLLFRTNPKIINRRNLRRLGQGASNWLLQLQPFGDCSPTYGVFFHIWRLDFWVVFLRLSLVHAPYNFFCLGTFFDDSTRGFLWFFFVFGVFSRYLVAGFLSFASQVVFNECTPYDFLLGDILWWIDPWVFVVSSCVQGLFTISGVWIFESCFAVCF